MKHKIYKKFVFKDGAVRKMWLSKDQKIASLLEMMGEQEYWCVSNDPLVKKEFNDFMELMADSSYTDDEFNNPETIAILVEAIAYMKSIYAFAFLKWLDDYRNSLLMAISQYCLMQVNLSDTLFASPAEIYLERMKTLRKGKLLSDLFEPERMARIEEMLLDYERITFGR